MILSVFLTALISRRRFSHEEILRKARIFLKNHVPWRISLLKNLSRKNYSSLSLSLCVTKP